MTKSKIYTIGYGGRRISWLLDQLEFHKINTLIDVRLKPYSPIPQYNKEYLESALKNNDVNYKHEIRGGNPFRRNTGYSDIKIALGNFRQKIIKEKTPEYFIDLFRKFYKAKRWPLVLLCTCSQAHRCHRGILSEEILKLNSKIEFSHLPEEDQIELF